MRVPVDITKLECDVSSPFCPVCNKTLHPDVSKPNTFVWYCSTCDVRHETTPSGVFLRTYKQDGDIIVNRLEVKDGDEPK